MSSLSVDNLTISYVLGVHFWRVFCIGVKGAGYCIYWRWRDLPSIAFASGFFNFHRGIGAHEFGVRYAFDKFKMGIFVSYVYYR